MYWLPDSTEWTTLMMAAFFPAETRIFSIRKLCTYSLLHTRLIRTLLLHTPQVTWYRHVFFVIVGWAMLLSIPNCTEAHYGTARRKYPEDGSKSLFVSWSFLIMWTKPPRVLLLQSLRLRRLLFNTAQVSWLRHVILILRREGDRGVDTWQYGGTLPEDCRWQLPWRWRQKIYSKAVPFYNVQQTAPGTTFSPPNLRVLPIYSSPDYTAANTPLMAAFFAAKIYPFR